MEAEAEGFTGVHTDGQKTFPALTSLDFCCNVQVIGSEFGGNGVDASASPAHAAAGVMAWGHRRNTTRVLLLSSMSQCSVRMRITALRRPPHICSSSVMMSTPKHLRKQRLPLSQFEKVRHVSSCLKSERRLKMPTGFCKVRSDGCRSGGRAVSLPKCPRARC